MIRLIENLFKEHTMMIFDKEQHLQVFLVIPDPENEKDAKRLKRWVFQLVILELNVQFLFVISPQQLYFQV